MQKNENTPNRKSIGLFPIITSSILVAAVIWFFILPFLFNSGSSLIKDIFSKKDAAKLEAFNPEAFAYDLDVNWEVNAIVNIKGFQQRKNESDDTFQTSISYSANIESPEGKIFENLYSDNVDISVKEKLMDLPIEVQFELDSTYSMGKYRVIFNIKDNNSGKSISGTAEFSLTR